MIVDIETMTPEDFGGPDIVLLCDGEIWIADYVCPPPKSPNPQLELYALGFKEASK